MSAPTPTSSSAEPDRLRRVARSVLLWLYGISITVFLVSIWGRAVVADTDLLAEAAREAAGSELVANWVEGWFEEALRESGVGDADGQVSELLVALPEVRSATAEVAGEVVRAAAASPEERVVVDVAAVYLDVVPAVTDALNSSGVAVTQDQVRRAVEQLDTLVIDRRLTTPPVGPRSGTARHLTVATLVALGAMVASGAAAVAVADDKRAMFRSLLNRVAVSGFTYFVFFQISAWVLDPRGGRANARSGLAHVVGAKLWIPLLIAGVAGAAGWTVRHRHRDVRSVRASGP